MRVSQCDQIVEYMKKHGSITQLDAYVEIGCMRLPSRIHDLRKQGYAIHVKTERVKKRDGGYAPIARYSLVGCEQVEKRWQPNKEGLGLGKVLDYVGASYE